MVKVVFHDVNQKCLALLKNLPILRVYDEEDQHVEKLLNKD